MATRREGGCEVLRLKKGARGKVLAILKRQHIMFWSSFNTGA